MGEWRLRIGKASPKGEWRLRIAKASPKKENPMTWYRLAATTAVLWMLGASIGFAQEREMSFFITSVGPGDGGNLGGIAGADAHCAKLAKAAGSTQTNWRAYLSVKPIVDRSSGRPVMSQGINARDRIGNGPWKNAKGVVIAKSVDDLHSSSNNLNIETALSEQGELINGRGQQPNRHDILTGSDPQGRYSTAGGDTTCGNWTSSSETGSAIVGHHDRAGLDQQWSSLSWNSSHGSRGCGAKDFPKSGGDGLFYCFVAN